MFIFYFRTLEFTQVINSPFLVNDYKLLNTQKIQPDSILVYLKKDPDILGPNLLINLQAQTR